MPSFVPPQRCKRVGRPPTGQDWVHEIKLDGYRMQLRMDDGEAVMRTRKGLDWTDKFAAIADAGRGLPDCIIDGEVVPSTITALRILPRCRQPCPKADRRI